MVKSPAGSSPLATVAVTVAVPSGSETLAPSLERVIPGSGGGSSLSRIFTDTLEMDIPEQPSSVLEAAWLMVALPSLESASSSASMVTRWGVFQSLLVNAREDLSADRLASPATSSVTVTPAVGLAVNTTS